MTKQPEALIAEMKAAAENATQGEWCTDSTYGVIADAGLNGNYYVASCSGPESRPNTRFIAKANPENVLTLIAALEQAQQHENVHYADAAEVEIASLRKRIAELEASETQLIEERDNAEEALADMYQAATGERPEWSNWFSFADAVDAVEQRLGELEASPLAVKLHKRSVGEVMHMSGFSRDYAEGWCAGNDNAIHEIRAAGGTVEGE